MEKRYGRFIGNNPEFPRYDMGSLKIDGRRYLMQTTMGGEPIIISPITGKRFVLEWHEIIGLAVAAGIDEADDGKEG